MFHVEHSGIKVKVLRNTKFITGVVVSGHSNSAPHGRDLICAAVSAITQTTLLALEKFGSMVSSGGTPGLLYVNLNNDDRVWRKVQYNHVLVTAMMDGLRSVANSHPGYITFEEEDVSRETTHP